MLAKGLEGGGRGAAVWGRCVLKQLKLNVQLARADLSSSRHALIIANILSYIVIVINRRPIIVMCINQINVSPFADVHVPGDKWPRGAGADQEGYPGHES